MFELLYPILNKILFLALISLRVTGFVFTVPILNSIIFPVRIKIIFVILISYLISKTLPVVNLLGVSLSFVLVLGVFEILTGIFFGIAIYFIFLAIQIAGVLVDNEFGTSLMNILDPTTNESMTIVSQIYVLLFSLVFLTIDGLNILLLSFRDTYNYIKIGYITQIDLKKLILLLDSIFAKSFVIASPIVMSSFLTTIILGIASRVVPELNVFFTAFPLRIMIGMIILMFSIFIFFNYSEFVVEQIPTLFKLLGKE
jgi:flagellar biosynthesis protein FliR